MHEYLPQCTDARRAGELAARGGKSISGDLLRGSSTPMHEQLPRCTKVWWAWVRTAKGGKDSRSDHRSGVPTSMHELLPQCTRVTGGRKVRGQRGAIRPRRSPEQGPYLDAQMPRAPQDGTATCLLCTLRYMERWRGRSSGPAHGLTALPKVGRGPVIKPVKLARWTATYADAGLPGLLRPNC
jgi:hypothetical protein